MGQSASSGKKNPTRTLATRNAKLNGKSSAKEKGAANQPTLKEQWLANKAAAAAAREAAAAERQKLKESRAAAAQQRQQKANVTGNDRDVSDDDSTDDSSDLQKAQAEVDAQLMAAQVSAQLACFQAFVDNNPLDGDDDHMGASGAFDTTAAMPSAERDGEIENVSLHSADYEDPELLQGLDDLGNELEEEYEQQVASLQKEIADYKKCSVVYLKEEQNKPAALEALQHAKRLEAQLKRLQETHTAPMHVQIEMQAKQVVELENMVAARKQDSLAAMRSGDKPAALEMLKEAKGFEKQLETAKQELCRLEEMKKASLYTKGEEG